MKLHVGCGKAYIPDWVNVDIFSNVHADVYSSALALPYAPGSIEIIYASHVLEHLSRHMILTALYHWHGLLEAEGILRLSVPNFRAICEYYNETSDIASLIGLLYGGQDSPLNIHHVVFDDFYLTRILQEVGFRSVRRWDWEKTEHSNIDDYSQAYLPHLDKARGKLMSLNLEARK